MPNGLDETDIDSVQEAVQILNEAGLDVKRIMDVEQYDHGVRFDLRIATQSYIQPLNEREAGEP